MAFRDQNICFRVGAGFVLCVLYLSVIINSLVNVFPLFNNEDEFRKDAGQVQYTIDWRQQLATLLESPVGSLEQETSLLYTIMSFIDYPCRDMHAYGGPFLHRKLAPGEDTEEGAWAMCADTPLREGCTAFSIGINHDFTFDDALAQQNRCMVHSFDPSMGLASHKRNDLSYFHNVGLLNITGSNIGTGMNGITDVWQVMTLQDMMKATNLTRLDVLKIDVEGSEWPAFEEMLRSPVFDDPDSIQHLMFEIHFWGEHSPQQHRHWSNIIMGVRRRGYRLYRLHGNPLSTGETMGLVTPHACCYELYFIRTLS